jgi:cell division protein FtsA
MYLLGVDFGSRYIKAALCKKEIDTGEILVEKLFRLPHKASKQGTVNDLVRAKEAFGQLLEKIKEEFNGQIYYYILSISGENVTSYAGTSTIPLWKQENEERRIKITDEHVKNVLNAAKMTGYNKDNKSEIHSIPQEFQIDDQPPTQNPVDMSGKNLKGTSYVIHADKAYLENLSGIPEAFGIENYKIVYAPLATGEAVLDEDDKDSGVIVISIGDQTTELVIYLNGMLRMAKVILLGSSNISKDLSFILKTSYQVANDLKKTVASSHYKEADPQKIIEVSNSSFSDHEITEQFIARITEARMKEIYEFVMKEVYKGAYQKSIHSPVVITGPGSRIAGSHILFSELNNSKTKEGMPAGIKTAADELTSDYFTAAGLVKYAINSGMLDDESQSGKKGLIKKMKDFFSDLI